jgi:hypothetical protein
MQGVVHGSVSLSAVYAPSAHMTPVLQASTLTEPGGEKGALNGHGLQSLALVAPGVLRKVFFAQGVHTKEPLLAA